MKITVITPVFNSAETIADTIESVATQTYDNFEHIIVDNLSTDSTLSIITDIYSRTGKIEKLNIISETDKGISEAFNKGIRASEGEIITILNGDDKYTSPDLFEDVINIFRENPETKFVHGDIIFRDNKYGSNRRKPLMCNPAEAFPFNHPAMFLKKEVYETNGLYDETNKFCMDFEFFLRLSVNHPEVYNSNVYFDKYSVTEMSAGGVSWKYESKMLNEMESIVRKYNLFDENIKSEYKSRGRRIRIKNILGKLGLSGIIKMWRNKKWK